MPERLSSTGPFHLRRSISKSSIGGVLLIAALFATPLYAQLDAAGDGGLDAGGRDAALADVVAPLDAGGLDANAPEPEPTPPPDVMMPEPEPAGPPDVMMPEPEPAGPPDVMMPEPEPAPAPAPAPEPEPAPEPSGPPDANAPEPEPEPGGAPDAGRPPITPPPPCQPGCNDDGNAILCSASGQRTLLPCEGGEVCNDGDCVAALDGNLVACTCQNNSTDAFGLTLMGLFFAWLLPRRRRRR